VGRAALTNATRPLCLTGNPLQRNPLRGRRPQPEHRAGILSETTVSSAKHRGEKEGLSVSSDRRWEGNNPNVRPNTTLFTVLCDYQGKKDEQHSINRVLKASVIFIY